MSIGVHLWLLISFKIISDRFDEVFDSIGFIFLDLLTLSKRKSKIALASFLNYFLSTTLACASTKSENLKEPTMACAAPVVETTISDLKLVRRGKVRDVYAVDEESLLIVATDRISAFDSVSPTPIERKGEVLTALSRFWFAKLGHVVPNHLLTTNIDEMPAVVRNHAAILSGRSMLVKRTEVFPVECVVRGYLSGSGWKDYQRTGQVCGAWGGADRGRKKVVDRP